MLSVEIWLDDLERGECIHDERGSCVLSINLYSYARIQVLAVTRISVISSILLFLSPLLVPLNP